jgi:hypothetical protein
METKTKSYRWAKYLLLFVLPIIIFSALAFTIHPENSAKGEILCNSSFHDLIVPNGWWFNGLHKDDLNIGIENNIVQHGNKSAFIESLVQHPNEFSTLMQECIKKDFKGKRVKMTGYIKSQGLNDTATMWVRIDDCDKKMSTDFDNMMERPIIGTKDWTKCEIIFDVADKCAIFYGFIFIGAGKFWVDNVSFEIVSNSINKTAHSLNAPFPEVYLDQLRQYPAGSELPEKPPVNLDFEE